MECTKHVWLCTLDKAHGTVTFLVHDQYDYIGNVGQSKINIIMAKFLLMLIEHVTVCSRLQAPLECVQGPGELLYVPSGWAHATINLDECVGLAVEFELTHC